MTTRRNFLMSAAVSAGLSPAVFSPAVIGEVNSAKEDKTFSEPAKKIPLHTGYDVIICGGGPAGIAAAIAAARSGAKTLLLELQGSLGGIWTSGLLTFIFDFDKDGLTREIKRKLTERNAIRFTTKRDFVYEPEEMKVLIEQMCLEAGVKIRLQTSAVAAYKEGQQLKTVITESKSGREAWSAPVFIDATGDGDLSFQAGCNFDYGRPQDGHAQPLTMNALAVVRDAEKIKEHITFYGEGGWNTHVPATKKNLEILKAAGVEPSYGMPTIFPVHENLVLLMFNHEYQIRPDNADQMTEATLRARKEIHILTAALDKLGGVWEGIRIAATAEQIGIREGRRIKGRYTVTKEDAAEGRRHADSAAFVQFGTDIHAVDRDTNRSETINRGGIKSKPYDIPFAALLPKDIDGLITAGRCISGDFVAHGSYRVTGNAVAMGEAAGIVAAKAAKEGKNPHQIQWNPELRSTVSKS